MSKLLNRPFKAFTLYALIVLACSVPVYYYVVESIWLEELDEHNSIIKERIAFRFGNTKVNNDELNDIIELWNVLQPGTSITPTLFKEIKIDSIYTSTHLNKYSDENEIDRFRGLSTYIKINKIVYNLKIETNVEEVDETLIAIALVTFVFFSIMIGGFIILNRYLSKKIWEPFNNTLNKLKNFDLLRDNKIEFEKTDIEEFIHLNNELEKLIRRNISIYYQQKSFIENASHELQTPLAVLKSKVEILLQNEKLSEDQSLIINSIHNQLSRVSRINKNLLLLAKIENDQFIEEEQVDVKDVIDESLEILVDYIIAKDIRLNIEKSVGLMLKCNRALMEILINNLLINAITHSQTNATLKIQLVNNLLIISNSGEAKLTKDSIFKRFSTISNTTNNSGLGLSIVQEICKRYDWEIEYDFIEFNHVFRLNF
jgi:signal transduction histidine kinase